MTDHAFPPCPTSFNLTAHVLQQAHVTPDKIALSIVKPTGAARWSYARLKSSVLGVATGLLDQGLCMDAPGFARIS